ncbi:MAG TPA: TonB family protein [Methylomirabilota bacterium]|nr:TonB family protein [Methylomirabilota bacterium]
MSMKRSGRIPPCAVVLAGVALFLSGCDRLISTHENKTQVDMAKVDHPTNMPDADKQDAIVVTVMRTGDVFLGQAKTSVDDLGAQVRDRLVGKTIYIRADALAPYRAVEDTIDAVRVAGVDDVGLLTGSTATAPQKSYFSFSKAPAASVGLDVSVPVPWSPIAPQHPNLRTIVVQVLHQPGGVPRYTINETDVTKAEMLGRLTDIYANRAERVIFVRGDDDIDFHYVAEVIDIAKAAGVDHIGLLTPKAEADFASFAPVAPVAIRPLPMVVIVPENNEESPTTGFGASESDTGGASETNVKPTAPQKVNISAGVAEGMLLQKTQPIYPPIAKAARIQGTVVLDVTISKTGDVESLRLVSGHPILVQPAMDAVRTWRYRPYLLNNEPVEVETTVNVIYTLGGSE